jgi:hypothetical protein
MVVSPGHQAVETLGMEGAGKGKVVVRLEVKEMGQLVTVVINMKAISAYQNLVIILS